MRWLDSITNSVDTDLSKVWEIVELATVWEISGDSLVCYSPWGLKE